MSTVYAIGDVPALTSSEQVAVDDVFFMYNTSSGRTVSITNEQLRGGAAAIVSTTATTLSVTATAHAGKIIRVASTAPIAITLPQATGTGNRYRFVIGVAATATSHTISVANSTDVMRGIVYSLTTSSDAVVGWKTSATSDRITLDGTTLGGTTNDQFEIVDMATGVFQVLGHTAPTGSHATPFSAAVP